MAKINLDIGHALSREDQRRNRRNPIFISQSFPLMSFSGNRAAKFSKKRFYRIRRKRDRPCKQVDSPLENPCSHAAASLAGAFRRRVGRQDVCSILRGRPTEPWLQLPGAATAAGRNQSRALISPSAKTQTESQLFISARFRLNLDDVRIGACTACVIRS
jgi:hypothetical protein